MSEIPRPDKDEFDALMAECITDPEFSDTIAGIGDDMDWKELSKLPFGGGAHGGVREQYERPHDEESLDEVVPVINDIFLLLCLQYGVDPKTLENNDERYIAIHDALIDEIYKLGGTLWQDDILVASEAFAFDLLSNSADEKDYKDPRPVAVVGGMKIVGTFYAPTIGPMPVDGRSAALNGPDRPALGVGLIIKDPFVVDPRGRVYPDAFKGDRAVISLNFQGSKLSKCEFLTGS